MTDMDGPDWASAILGAVLLVLAGLVAAAIYLTGAINGRNNLRESFRTCVVQEAPLLNCLDAAQLVAPASMREASKLTSTD